MTDPASGSPRYARQTGFAPFGLAGQARLAAARITVVGVGALGTRSAELLARAGVGALRLVDRDIVDVGNLHRQTLFDEADAAAKVPKALAAAAHLRACNAEVAIEAQVADVTAANVAAFVADATIVIDGSDNFETRFVLNDACVQANVPWIYGGVVGATGMVLPVLPGRGPCLRCLIAEVPPPGSLPTVASAGVLNTAPAIIASLQVSHVYRLLADPHGIAPRLVYVDLWHGRCDTLDVARNPNCGSCGFRGA